VDHCLQPSLCHKLFTQNAFLFGLTGVKLVKAITLVVKVASVT